MRLVGIAVCCLVAILLLLAFWQHKAMASGLPERIVCSSPIDAHLKAGPNAIEVLGTGSMAPFIQAAPKNADPLKTVVALAKPSDKTFSEIKKGDLIVYWADWAHGNVIHQAAQKDSGGWIMSGLHNAQSESFARVTAESFRAVIEEVYVW